MLSFTEPVLSKVCVPFPAVRSELVSMSVARWMFSKYWQDFFYSFFFFFPNSLPMPFSSGLWSSGSSFGLRCILQIYVCSGTTIFSEKTGVGGPLADVRWGHICLLHQAKEIFFLPSADWTSSEDTAGWDLQKHTEFRSSEKAGYQHVTKPGASFLS